MRHALDFDQRQNLLGAEQGVLFGNHVDVGIDAGFITLGLQIKRNPGRFHGLMLLLDLLCQDTHGCKRVFHLLEGSKHGLPIGGQIGVIDCGELIDGGAAETRVEDRL